MVGRGWIAIVVLALASGARAQPGVAVPAPVVQAPEPWLRLSFGGGASGTLGTPRDLDGTLGMEATVTARLNEVLSFGLHGHVSVRNWAVISDFYRDLNKSPASSDALYGYAFGWLAGTGVLAGGPELVFGTRDEFRPWVAVGTSLFLYLDTRERTNGVVGGHGATAAVGYDLGPVGISVRGMYAPASGTVLGTTGPPVAYVLATFDVRTRP